MKDFSLFHIFTLPFLKNGLYISLSEIWGVCIKILTTKNLFIMKVNANSTKTFPNNALYRFCLILDAI